MSKDPIVSSLFIPASYGLVTLESQQPLFKKTRAQYLGVGAWVIRHHRFVVDDDDHSRLRCPMLNLGTARRYEDNASSLVYLWFIYQCDFAKYHMNAWCAFSEGPRLRKTDPPRIERMEFTAFNGFASEIPQRAHCGHTLTHPHGAHIHIHTCRFCRYYAGMLVKVVWRTHHGNFMQGVTKSNAIIKVFRKKNKNHWRTYRKWKDRASTRPVISLVDTRGCQLSAHACGDIILFNPYWC